MNKKASGECRRCDTKNLVTQKENHKMFVIPIHLALTMALITGLSEPPKAQARPMVPPPEIFYLETTTDANSNFDVDHRIILAPPGRAGRIIVGVIVSVQNKTNRAWYTVYATGTGSRIAFGDKTVSGRLHEAAFQNQRVRILIFTFTRLE